MSDLPALSTASAADKLPTSTVPAELIGEIATTRDGRDITRPWIFELEQYRDQRLLGAIDWGVYDKILLDDQVRSCLEQRRSAVVSREWSVLPGADDPRAKAAADALEKNLQNAGWDRVTDKMLYAPYYGVSIAELGWAPWTWTMPNGQTKTLIGFVGTDRMKPIHVRHARRFRYDKNQQLRLLTPQNMMGEVLPDRKFWVVTAGASDDDEHYGRGMAEWLYWPCFFKRNGIRFWNLFLDKFSLPPTKGTYPRGTSMEDINKLLGAMAALANDSAIAIPEGMAIELMQIATNGIDFEKMPAYMDEAIAKIILSQTMTSKAQAGGLGSNQASVHAGVKQELIVSDSDLLTESFTTGPARWFTDLNFGPDVAAPIVMRLVEEEGDTKSVAETDAILAAQGWERTEESFRDIYGEGYVRAKTPLTTSAPPGTRRAPVDGGTLQTNGGAGDSQPGKETDNPGGELPTAASFAEAPPPRDLVDDATAQIMQDEGWTEGKPPIAGALFDELAQATSPEEVQQILARSAELDDEADLTETLARAGFAVGMAARTGTDGTAAP